MEKLIIIGASGHGKVAADIALKLDKWKTIAFLDNNLKINECLGFRVLDKSDNFSKYIDIADFFVAIGDNNVRGAIFDKLTSVNIEPVSLISPDAILGKDVAVNCGSIVMAGAVINSSAKIGKGCIINTNSNVDHDCKIGDFAHVSPGVNLAGNVTVGNFCWLGIGSSIINNVEIGEDSIVGAGAVVIRDIPENCTAVGNPAKVIKYHE